MIGIDNGKNSMDSIRGRVYASDHSRSRLDKTPDVAASPKNLKTHSPDVDGQVYVMAPKQSHIENTHQGKTFGIAVNDLRSFHTSEAEDYQTMTRVNSVEKQPPRGVSAMTMSA